MGAKRTLTLQMQISFLDWIKPKRSMEGWQVEVVSILQLISLKRIRGLFLLQKGKK